MGRWATYLIGRERDDPPAAYARHGGTAAGWAWWELPLARGDAWDPGQGHAIVAHIFDSDVADIRGLESGKLSWRWVFGEAILAEYEGRSVDDLDLEDSLPKRARQASQLITDWAAGAGLPAVDGAALAEILQGGYVFAEEGFGAVLEAVGIVADDSTVESRDLEPMVDARGEAFGETSDGKAKPVEAGQTMAGVLAAAIDHTSTAWRGLVATRWLHTFGEPPSMVALDGMVFVAFDPPISLGSYGRDSEREWVSQHLGVSGEWQEVPAEHAGGLLDAAAWGRDHVGAQGRLADEDRLPLNIELPLDYPDGVEAPYRYPDVSKDEWWQYSVAGPQQVGIELAMGTGLLDRADEVADWLEHARSLLLTPLAEKYEESGGKVYSGEGDVPPYGLSLSMSYKSVRGRYGSTRADDNGWGRVMRRLRAGELTSVKLGAAVADVYGHIRDVQPWGELSIRAQLAADRRLYSLPAHLTVKISEPMRGLVARPFVNDLISRAAAKLPVVGGWVDAARILMMGDGWSRYEQFAGLRSDVRRDPRVCVRGPAWRILLGPGHLALLGGRPALEASGLFTDFQRIDTPDGPLLMGQCGEQPGDCTAERRARMVEVLAPVLPPWPA